MASTSTNKQPLFIDRVLHYVFDLDAAYNNGIIIGTNTAVAIVDATGSDGAILEDVYLISKSETPANVNLYISPSRDFLRQGEGKFVGQITSASTIAGKVSWDEMPRTLAPVPYVSNQNNESFNRAFFLPKGTVLWAARDDDSVINDQSGPLIGCQGGWY